MSKAQIKAETKFLLHPDAVHRKLQGEEVLLQMQTGRYFGLDEIGTKAWDALVIQQLSLGQCARQLAEEFAVDEKTVQNDISHLVSDLLEQGLLEAVKA